MAKLFCDEGKLEETWQLLMEAQRKASFPKGVL